MLVELQQVPTQEAYYRCQPAGENTYVGVDVIASELPQARKDSLIAIFYLLYRGDAHSL
jgi:hypothetical protein